MMSCASSILCCWIVILCWNHIMMSCAGSILCRWVVILCCHHVMMSCACSILCRWIVRLCCLYIMMSCSFFISCRWVVVLCCQNNVITLCCHHIITSYACFILCWWVTMLYWMFGTDLTFETNFRLKPFRYSVTSVFCSFDSSPVTLQPEKMTYLVLNFISSDLFDCNIGFHVQEGWGKGLFTWHMYRNRMRKILHFDSSRKKRITVKFLSLIYHWLEKSY